MATLSAVTMGVLSATPTGADDSKLLASSAISGASASDTLAQRGDLVSRSQPRQAARRATARQEARQDARQDARQTKRAVAAAEIRLWTTTDLNVWDAAEEDARKVGLLDALTKVLVTGRRDHGRAEVVLQGTSRWVTADYLSEEKPEEGPNLGGACANGSSIDAGHAALYKVHDAVCSNWPEIGSYGTWRGDGEHGQGRAIDVMVSGQTGWDIANFLRANYSALGIEYIIYAQKIWSVERGGEGWRAMSNRGSVTANHFDHVHVTVW